MRLPYFADKNPFHSCSHLFLNSFIDLLIPDLVSDDEMPDSDFDNSATVDMIAAAMLWRKTIEGPVVIHDGDDEHSAAAVVNGKLRTSSDRKRDTSTDLDESPKKRVRLPGIGYLNLK